MYVLFCRLNLFLFILSILIVGSEWTSAAVDAFEDLTHTAKWKAIMSKTVGRHVDDSGFQMPSVRLVDTNGPTVMLL